MRTRLSLFLLLFASVALSYLASTPPSYAAATKGSVAVAVSGPQVGAAAAPRLQAGPAFSNLLFSSGVTASDTPTRIITSLPAGSEALYLFWDYSGMEDGLLWEARWYYEGEYIPEISIGPEAWVGGASGNWWVAIFGSPLPDGNYDVELVVEEQLLASATISTGEGAPAPSATPASDSTDLVPTPVPTRPTVSSDSPFGPVTFALDIDDEGNPINTGTRFPTGTPALFIFWDYSGMEDGMEWAERWLLDGEELVVFDDTWVLGDRGSAWDTLYRTDGVPLWNGVYTIELYVEGELVQTATATIGTGTTPPTSATATPVPPPVPTSAGPASTGQFTNLRFAPAVTTARQPVSVVESLPSGSTQLYAVFDYSGMTEAMQYEARWYQDGVFQPNLSWGPVAWEGGPSGTWWSSIFNNSGLVDATYDVELVIDGQVVLEGTIVVGNP